MISVETLYQKLIDSGMFEVNKYLDKYVELMIKNIDQPAEKDLTQKHHILPRHYYQHRNISVDNSKENLINLPIYDHIRAHYFLYMCVRDQAEKYSNLYALRRMLGGNFTDLAQIEFLDDTECLELYQKYNELNRDAHTGTTHEVSDETKRKISLANKDKYHDYKSVHNDKGEERRVPESELPFYLDGGWILGRSPKTINNLKAGYNYDSKGMLGKTQSDYQKEQARKAQLGKPKSADARKNMSDARLGKKLYIDPKTGKGKYISSDEIEYYEKLGWFKK
jgi:hypothetical protein